jgi:hypothetical protein
MTSKGYVNPDELVGLLEAEARARDDILEMLSELAFAATNAPMPMDYFDGFTLLLDAYQHSIEARARAETRQRG